MKWIFIKLTAFLLSLSSLWIGSYYMHVYSSDSWQGFPIFVTTCTFFILGIIAIVLIEDIKP